MMQVEFVEDLNIFLEKAEYGINHTYQLHQELGCVFIDASFSSQNDEESPQLLYKTRIEVAPPVLVSTSLRWDTNGFPYEVETYNVGGKEVIVPFYRPLGVGWRSFLLDVVEELKELISDDTLTTTEFVIPPPLVEGLRNVAKNIREITAFLNDRKTALSDNECLAIDRHFGECGLWERLVEDTGPALATYLGSAIFVQREAYEKICEEQTAKRHEALIVADVEVINNLENTLRQHKFKKGYVS